jgi:hypothetical protein
LQTLRPRRIRHVVSLARPRFAPATRPGSGRRQGERRGPRSARVGPRDEVLGGDYRFKTRFYLDDKRVLYVRGGGDPFLISEELAPLATKLVAAVGKMPIAGIVLDASYYPSNLRIPGIEDTDEALQCAELRAGGEFQHCLRRAQRQQGALRREPRSPRSRSTSSGCGALTEAAASA